MKILLFFIMLFFLSTVVWGRIIVDMETGYVWNGYNDTSVPKSTGDRFSLTDDLSLSGKVYTRFRLGYELNDRNSLFLLAAPLTVRAKGKFDRDIIYNKRTFLSGKEIRAKYRFDSYRLIYRYYFKRSDDFQWGLGVAAKIRDAEITLEDDHQKSTKLNTGFVPLINFNFEFLLFPETCFIIDGDALAGPQGRAEDVLLAVSYNINNRISVRIGYRLLEGGADVEEVYNFTAFHYLSTGISISF